MAMLKPFADDSSTLTIGDLNVENGHDRIAIYGSLDVTRDKIGLKRARDLKALLEDALRTLEADRNLPDRLPPPGKPATVKNPFG
jgi:hypothetical protein